MSSFLEWALVGSGIQPLFSVACCWTGEVLRGWVEGGLDLEDGCAEGDCEELLHVAGQGSSPRDDEPDIATKGLLEGLEQQFVQQWGGLQNRKDDQRGFYHSGLYLWS